MTPTPEQLFMGAVRTWASDLIGKQRASNTLLCAAALEYAEAFGYRPPKPPRPPEPPITPSRFRDTPDYRIKIGNGPVEKAWHCRDCGVVTPNPSAHTCENGLPRYKAPSFRKPMLRRPPSYGYKRLELHFQADRLDHTITTVYQCNRCRQIYDKPTQHWCDPTREEENTP